MSETSNHLLTDVNLAGIEISGNGMTVTLNFINMQDGGICARLVANGVVALNYHNTFESEEDALPAYVGEVTLRELDEDECEPALLRLGYGFVATGVDTFVSRLCNYVIHAEGGGISVALICSSYRLDRP